MYGLGPVVFVPLFHANSLAVSILRQIPSFKID